MTFGEKLRESRAKKGMTQSELAKAANLGLNTISNYESGKHIPRKEKYMIYSQRSLRLTLIISEMKMRSLLLKHLKNMDIEVSNKPISLYRRLAAYLQAVSCPMMKWMAL